MRLRWLTLGLLVLVTAASGSGAVTGQEEDDTRSFHLGFTPFPYAISNEAVEYTYERIAEDADLIVHHFDNGVPWTEALAGESYHDNLRNDWIFRRREVPPETCLCRHRSTVTVSITRM
jgi:hypothetical protein